MPSSDPHSEVTVLSEGESLSKRSKVSTDVEVTPQVSRADGTARGNVDGAAAAAAAAEFEPRYAITFGEVAILHVGGVQFGGACWPLRCPPLPHKNFVRSAPSICIN
jgi:hypothetical protein